MTAGHAIPALMRRRASERGWPRATRRPAAACSLSCVKYGVPIDSTMIEYGSMNTSHAFCVAMIGVPCQIVRGARRVVYRLLSWNPWQGVFLRLVERLNGRRLC